MDLSWVNYGSHLLYILKYNSVSQLKEDKCSRKIKFQEKILEVIAETKTKDPRFDEPQPFRLSIHGLRIAEDSARPVMKHNGVDSRNQKNEDNVETPFSSHYHDEEDDERQNRTFKVGDKIYSQFQNGEETLWYEGRVSKVFAKSCRCKFIDGSASVKNEDLVFSLPKQTSFVPECVKRECQS